MCDGDRFVTGACVGGDQYIARKLVEMYPERQHELIVPANRSRVDTDFLQWFVERIVDDHISGAIHYMNQGTSYRDRNAWIVSESDHLTAFPYSKLEKPYSGTWMTVNIARDTGVPYDVIVLP